MSEGWQSLKGMSAVFRIFPFCKVMSLDCDVALQLRLYGGIE